MIDIPLSLLTAKYHQLLLSGELDPQLPIDLRDSIASSWPENLIHIEGEEGTRSEALFHLLNDLADRNWQVRVSKNGSENAHLSILNPNNLNSKKQIQQSMMSRRLELMKKYEDWIRHTEPKILKYFADGDQVNPATIKPELEECTEPDQRDIFRYCRFLSSVPYSDYVGRRMYFLIRDGSLPFRPIIGIAALGSSLLQISCRDEWIGWNKKELRNTKKIRIGNMMDLFVAVSIPPYNELLGGKLVCYTMVSNEVREAFMKKYSEQKTLGKKRIIKDLVMIITTSIYGHHSSQYNRLKFNNENLYIPVGETVGFGTLHISDRTFESFRELLASNNASLSHKFGEGANWRLRVIRNSLQRLGFDANQVLLHGQSRGVFAVPLAQNAREFLCGETDLINYKDYPLEGLVAHWRHRWLNMRIKNPTVVERVKNIKAANLRLTNLLNAVY